MAISAGGKSTINGVLFQMLWTLLNAVQMRVAECDANPETLTASSAFLIVEPVNGGDLARIDGRSRRVQQLKTRSTGSKWSLTEIVRDVLADLYRAVELDGNSTYEFVTEGARGDWNEVEDLFKSFRDNENLVLDEHPIHFDHKSKAKDAIFPSKSYTKRSLFETIVARLQLPAESYDLSCEKVRHLLSRFYCSWEVNPSVWKNKIDSFLREVADYTDDIDEKRAVLLQLLATEAIKPNAAITPLQLFESAGLTATNLSNWRGLLTCGSRLLNGDTLRLRYAPNDDVRPLRELPSDKPIIVLSGGSGQGKSWRLFSLGRYLCEANITALVEATGDVNRDLDAAASKFWHDIAGHEKPLQIGQIAKRIRGIEHTPEGRWLYLCVDRLDDSEEARQLATLPWEDWGICLIVAGSPAAAKSFAEFAGNRASIHTVPDFNTDEMQEYLAGSNMVKWRAIPADIRDTLRRPLLARLYKDLAGDRMWSPTTEYALYDRWWSRVRGNSPMPAAALLKLAQSVAFGSNYPWMPIQVLDAGIDQSASGQLLKHGGMQEAQGAAYEALHDRLLNWMVAEGLVQATVTGSLSLTELCDKTVELFKTTKTYSGRILGYVPMDVFWIVCTKFPDRYDIHDAILEQLVDTDWRTQEVLFEHLLPSIGPAVIAPIVRYALRGPAKQSTEQINRLVASCLSNFSSSDLEPVVPILLAHTNVEIIDLGMRLAITSPSALYLDMLWKINCTLDRRPETLVKLEDRRNTIWYEMRCFAALKSCVRLNPSWLEQIIEQANSAQEPVHDLAYLLANLPEEGELWRRVKRTLMQKVAPEKERSLASNIFTHNDGEEIGWLVDRVGRNDDSLGSYAFRGLIRLDPHKAAELLKDLPGDELYLTRAWCLRSLLTRLPSEANAELQAMIQKPQNVGYIREAFSGQTALMTPEILRFFLDRLQESLEATNSLEDNYRPLRLLSEINRLELLTCFEERRGTPLEDKLASLLAATPRPYLSQEIASREPAFDVLHRIGGGGIEKVLVAWLRGPHVYGKYDASEVAAERQSQEVVRALADVASATDPPEQHASYAAFQALGKMGAWPEVITTILRKGWHEMPLSILSSLPDGVHLDDSVMTEAIEIFNSTKEGNATAVAALGIGRRSDFLEPITQLLNGESSSSDLAHACTLAISVLDDPDGKATDVLARQVSDKQMEHYALSGLLRNINPRALHVLIDYVQTNLDSRVLSIMLKDKKAHEGALAALSHHWTLTPSKLDSIVALLVHYCSDDEIRTFAVKPDAKEALEDRAFSFERSYPGAECRANSMLALATIDRDVVFSGARYAIEQHTLKDRYVYPYVLAKIDPARAIPLLFESAMREPSTAVRASIARALAGIADDAIPTLINWGSDSDHERRVAACRVGAYFEPIPQIQELLRNSVNDSHAEVTQAAEEGLWCQLNATWSRELMAEYSKETDHPRRWRLLRSVLTFADLGDQEQLWPRWFSEPLAFLPYAWIDSIQDQAKKRREEYRKALEDQDRDS